MLLSFPHPSPSLCVPSPKNPKPFKKQLILFTRSSLPTRPASATASTTAIQRIADKLRSLGYIEPNANPTPKPPTGGGSAGEIFVPTPQEIPKHRVGYTIDSSWSTPENPVPEPGAGLTRFRELWRKDKEESRAAKKGEERVPMVAELTIPAAELKRLRGVGIRLEKRLKVGKAGITEGIVNGIHERWRRSELVKIKCEDLCRLNMKRTHEILERKTGGLVVWRSGSIIILYRGVNYKYPYFDSEDDINSNLKNIFEDPSMTGVATMEHDGKSLPTSDVYPSAKLPHNLSHPSLVGGVGSPNKVRLQLPGEVQLEVEAESLLDGLGPRFTDWWGYEPLPVDADLLPAIVPGFRKPFRLLPFGVKPKLTDREMTVLRRLSRPLPCHFALGRNRKLQGLAVSMIKLWEKCEVAKVAVKRGVQNTNSEIMVEELKQLTGGVLLSRDKEFIVFYRGKDFLPSAVSSAIEKRRKTEVGRPKPSSHNSPTDTASSPPPLTIAGHASVDVFPEAIKKTWSTPIKSALKPSSLAIKRVETKLAQALEKRENAEKLLATLEKSVDHPVVESDKEAISEEERYMLRRVGLTMKPFLLLGRRGVFTGTVENMHLHWKYRELVKIISKERSIEQVEIDARTLEAESDGILVAVERVNKGHAIIIYRGKNYRRPADLRPNTLLSKKQAMRRSLEAQRCASLKLHVLSLSRNIDRLQHQMAKESSVVDKTRLTWGVKSDAEDDIIELSFSIERDNGSTGSSDHQENDEEVNEAAAEYLDSDMRDCISNEEEESTIRSNSVTNSNVHLNLRQQDTWIAPEQVDELRKNENEQPQQQNGIALEQVNELSMNENDQPHRDNWIALEQVDELSTNKNDHLAIDPTTSTNMLYVHAEHIFNEPDFPSEPRQQEQVSISATNTLSHFSSEEEAKFSFRTAQKKMGPHIHEDTLKDDSQLENCFRAAPLSNRERLILRRQALKMRKRPVLAVGRNNIVTGVAKTIKTHFEKHPLAIVNIKGRAKGTSVQEVIFELEQATGAVLVSREPNKVILYRGWGEREAPPGGTTNEKKDARKGRWRVNEDEKVSPKLMEAIRVECGLSISGLE